MLSAQNFDRHVSFFESVGPTTQKSVALDRFSFSRIGGKSGVKIHVRFALRHCRADRSARQIVAYKPAYRSTEISPLSSEAKVRNLIAEIRVVSLISANFVCISFAQYCKSIELLIR